MFAPRQAIRFELLHRGSSAWARGCHCQGRRPHTRRTDGVPGAGDRSGLDDVSLRWGRGRTPGFDVQLHPLVGPLHLGNAEGVPGLSAATAVSNCDTLPTALSSTFRITSPGRMPAWRAVLHAGDDHASVAFHAEGFGQLGDSSLGSTPIQPRVTWPSFTMPSSTRRAVDTGMAKPMPMLPPERE